MRILYRRKFFRPRGNSPSPWHFTRRILLCFLVLYHIFYKKARAFGKLALNDKLGFIGELSKPSPVGEGGPPMAVDEEFFMFVTTHPSARQYLILTILCTLLASTVSRKRRLMVWQFRIYFLFSNISINQNLKAGG